MKEAFPEMWAMAQYDLGNAYHNRIAGERQKNLDLATQHYNSALEVFTKEAFPEMWA